MNNTLQRLICTSILISTALVSLYLTYQFTYNLGVEAGMYPLVFALIGIILDVTKTIAPSLAFNSAKRSPTLSILLCLLSLSLIATSMLASMSALESSVTNASLSSREHQVIDRKISNIETEISSLTALLNNQISINHTTKAANTQQLLTAKNEELNALLDSQANLVPDTILSRFSTEITLGVSLLLEIISVLMCITLHQLRSVTHSDASVTPSVTSPVKSTATQLQAVTQQTRFPTPELTHTTTFAAKEITASQIESDIKQAVLGGLVRPSHRAIRAQFKVGQQRIKEILDGLHDDGYLVPHNNGYKLQLA